jgi:hypothetical protein
MTLPNEHASEAKALTEAIINLINDPPRRYKASRSLATFALNAKAPRRTLNLIVEIASRMIGEKSR